MTKKKAADSDGAEPKKTVKKAAPKKAAPKKAAVKKAAATDETGAVKVVKKATKKTTSRSKKAAEADARVKLYWGVFSPTMKRVAVFHYHEKKLAEKKAKELSDGKEGKSPHFVAKIKEAIDTVA